MFVKIHKKFKIFLVFLAMEIQVTIFWVLTLCSDVVGCHNFRVLYCLHLLCDITSRHPEDGGSMVLLPHHYTALQPN